ncbi:MAG TPA: transcriptional repressor [bacterium]|nr:transcriptional repressor [bacterium]
MKESPRPGRGAQPAAAAPVDWNRVGLRRTPQREVVLSLVRSCYEHPTAEWIHREARTRLPDISLATVYRTLRLLKEKGLIHEFSGGASPSRFDGTLHDPHEHVRCIRCGFVADVDVSETEQLRRTVAKITGFRIERYPLLFHGICADCVARAKAERKPGESDDSEREWAEGFW